MSSEYPFVRAWARVQGQPRVIEEARVAHAVATCAPHDAYDFVAQFGTPGVWCRASDLEQRYGDDIESASMIRDSLHRHAPVPA